MTSNAVEGGMLKTCIGIKTKSYMRTIAPRISQHIRIVLFGLRMNQDRLPTLDAEGLLPFPFDIEVLIRPCLLSKNYRSLASLSGPQLATARATVWGLLVWAQTLGRWCSEQIQPPSVAYVW